MRTRALLTWLAMIPVTVFWAAVATPWARVVPRLGDTAQRRWAAAAVRLAGLRIVGSPPPADLPGPYVIMCNHESHLDPPVLLLKLPVSPRFVAKSVLFWIPFFGIGMWSVGHIPINRGQHERAVRSLARAAERVRTGTTVLVFPEGTRARGPGLPLGTFKKGGFMLALQAQVPILPVAVAGTADCLPRGAWAYRPNAPVAMVVGTPVSTTGLGRDDRDRLMAEVRAQMEALREQARVEVAAAS